MKTIKSSYSNFTISSSYHLINKTPLQIDCNNHYSKHLFQVTSRKFSTNNKIDKTTNKKEKEIKANYKDIKNVIFPLFKTKPVKRFLMYSVFLTIGSKLLITSVRINIKFISHLIF